MLADYKKANPVVSKVMDESSDVAKWFNDHSFALGELNKEQADMYNGKVLALITPVVTRWTVYYCSLDRKLQLWKALRVTSIKHNDAIMETVTKKAKIQRKARRVLKRVCDESWWEKAVMYDSRSINASDSHHDHPGLKPISSPSPLP